MTLYAGDTILYSYRVLNPTRILKSVFHPLKRYYEEAPNERGLVLEALRELAWVRCLVWLVPFRRIARSLEKGEGNSKPTTNEELAKRIGWAVRSVARYAPPFCTCLVQSLAAHRMLRRRGFQTETFLGVTKEEETGEIKAHAWLRCCGQILTGEERHHEFTPIAHFQTPTRDFES